MARLATQSAENAALRERQAKLDKDHQATAPAALFLFCDLLFCPIQFASCHLLPATCWLLPVLLSVPYQLTFSNCLVAIRSLLCTSYCLSLAAALCSLRAPLQFASCHMLPAHMSVSAHILQGAPASPAASSMTDSRLCTCSEQRTGWRKLGLRGTGCWLRSRVSMLVRMTWRLSLPGELAVPLAQPLPNQTPPPPPRPNQDTI